jgi:RES domain-containing protein
MKLYRLTGADHASDLDGMGAALKKGGARWNATGVPMIYCAEHRSLAFAEVLAHFKEMSRFPRNYVFITYNVTGAKGIRRPAPASLPADWNTNGPPYSRGAQGYGSAFIASNDLLLRVPSAVIPHEWNYLMNPNALAGRVTLETIEPFVVDSRYDVFIPEP